MLPLIFQVVESFIYLFIYFNSYDSSRWHHKFVYLFCLIEKWNPFQTVKNTTGKWHCEVTVPTEALLLLRGDHNALRFQPFLAHIVSSYQRETAHILQLECSSLTSWWESLVVVFLPKEEGRQPPPAKYTKCSCCCCCFLLLCFLV